MDEMKLGLASAAENYVETCFVAATPPHVNELAAIVGQSPSALSRRLQAVNGFRLSIFFRKLQVARACDLLRRTDMPVTGIAAAAAFGSIATFYRIFAHERGCSPAAWRDANIEN